jgi:ribosomal protein L20
MPRSVNNVASKARRRKVLKQVKGQFGRRKNVLQLPKMHLKKASNTLIATGVTRKGHSAVSGLTVSMPLRVSMV